MSDDEIFPNAIVVGNNNNKNKYKNNKNNNNNNKQAVGSWNDSYYNNFEKKNEEQRWKCVSAQAAGHEQDGSVLHIQRRMTPTALQMGMPRAAAARVKSLYLPVPAVVVAAAAEVERRQQQKQQAALGNGDDHNNTEDDHCCKGLPEWLDVVSAKFPNLQHLHLMENETNDNKRSSSSSGKVKAAAAAVGSGDDDGDGDDEKDDDDDKVLTPSKSRRLRRLYVLYRLPDLVSIDGNPVTRQERQLARPQDRNGEKVNRDEWVDDDNNNKLLKNHSKNGARMSPQANKSVPGDAVEVCLSGSIKMTDVQGTRKELVEKVRMPLLDSDDEKKEEGNVAPRDPPNMDPLGLDKFEYVSVESSAHCDWGVACGSLSLPYFRPDSASRIKNCIENSKSRFRISLRQKKGSEKPEQRSCKPLEKQGVSKVEKKLAAGGRRTHDLVVDNHAGTIQTSHCHEKRLISKRTLRSYSENDMEAMLPKDTQNNRVPGNIKKHASVGNLERSSVPPPTGKVPPSTRGKMPQIIQKKVAAGGKRDNVLLLLDEIEQTRSPRIRIGLVEQVETSPRFQSTTGVELKLSSPKRNSLGTELSRHQSAVEPKYPFSTKKQEPSTQKIEKKLASGGSRSRNALLEVGERIDEMELARVGRTDNNCSRCLDESSIAKTPPRQVASASSSPQTQGRQSLSSSAPKPAGNLPGKNLLTTGSPSRRIPASKSLTSPFPMQFRSRPCAAKPPSPHRELETASFLQKKTVEAPVEGHSAHSPWKDLKVNTEVNDRGQILEGPSPPPPPREPSPSLHTIDSVKPLSPIRLLRVQSSPSKLGRRALLGDLPPPCPSGGRQRVLASPPRRLRPKQNLVKWRQKQTARSTSIIDNEEEDEFSSDEDNLELD